MKTPDTEENAVPAEKNGGSGRAGASFLSVVRKRLNRKREKNDLLGDFANDFEVMYATLFSIIEFSGMKDRARNETFAELTDFADSLDIERTRQSELRQKVQLARWDARETIRKQGIESFLDDFVAICLQDKKIQPLEYKLIYQIGSCLNLEKSEVSGLLRARLRKLRYRAILFFERPWVSALITALIVLNAIQLGLATSPWFAPYKGTWFDQLDFIFIFIFTVEMMCRIFAFRKDFFKEPQNVFDFIVVAVSWIPSPVFRWASALRIFRAMLLLNRFGQLKAIMKSLLDALPNIGWVSLLLFIVYYVFAVFTTNLFGPDFASFRSIEKSLLSLFQLMTLESWPELLSPVLGKYPWSWLVFIPFIILTSYIFLNLVIGIIVTSMHDISLKKKSTEKSEIDEIRELKEQTLLLSEQIATIRKALNKNGNEKQ